MIDLAGYAHAAFALSAAAAVFAGLLAAVTWGGEGGWGANPGGRLERLASPPWLRRRVEPRPWGGDRKRAGRRALFLAPVAASGAICGFILAGGVVPAAIVGLGAAWAWEAAERARAEAGRRRFGEELEAALEVMVASLKAGRGLVEALEDASVQSAETVRTVLGEVITTHRAGRPLGEALDEMTRKWPLSELTYLGACLRAHARAGGDVTTLLLNLGGVLRERRRLARDLGAKTGEARSTATVLALLPPGLLAYILWAGPGQLRPLLGSAFGVAALVYAAVSWAVGVLVIRWMLAVVSRQIQGEG